MSTQSSFAPSFEEVASTYDLLGSCAFPQNLNAIFVPGRAKYDNCSFRDNGWLIDEGVLEAADRVWRSERIYTAQIVFPGEDGSYVQGVRQENGYPGFLHWRRELQMIGKIDLSRVIAAPELGGEKRTTNTGAECDSFVSLAAERAWRRAAIVASHYHMPRAFATALMALKKINYEMDLFPVHPLCTDMSRQVYGSGGLERRQRTEHMRDEHRKWPSYIEKGYMVSFREMNTCLEDLRFRYHR